MRRARLSVRRKTVGPGRGGRPNDRRDEKVGGGGVVAMGDTAVERKFKIATGTTGEQERGGSHSIGILSDIRRNKNPRGVAYGRAWSSHGDLSFSLPDNTSKKWKLSKRWGGSPYLPRY